jgi:hypothetical protein
MRQSLWTAGPRPYDSPVRPLPRWLAAAVAAAIVVAGLLVRAQTSGFFAKYAGVALYAALIYAIVVFLAPRAAPVVAGAIALGVCWAIEFAQLTPLPAALSSRSVLARLILGATFSPADLIGYAVGIAVMLGLHGVANRIRRQARRRPSARARPDRA